MCKLISPKCRLNIEQIERKLSAGEMLPCRKEKYSCKACKYSK